MKGRGQKLVVDADVGRGAADASRADRGEVVDARALAFARALDAAYRARHEAVFSPKLWAEWRKHMGGAGRRWLARLAERGLLIRLAEEPDDAWLTALTATHLTAADAAIADKDAHLVATARVTMNRLVSGDGAAREKYVRLALHDAQVAAVHWVDPVWPDARRWLLDRAPERPDWTLGGA